MKASTNPIPGNPYTKHMAGLAEAGTSVPVSVAPVLQVLATLALAYEQHQRNRLAAITAMSKGLDLPPDLEDLATEGAER